VVEATLVADITYLTWMADNLLRHTVYVGLREDKPAERQKGNDRTRSRSDDLGWLHAPRSFDLCADGGIGRLDRRAPAQHAASANECEQREGQQNHPPTIGYDSPRGNCADEAPLGLRGVESRSDAGSPPITATL
jgi:hypothetical protein